MASSIQSSPRPPLPFRETDSLEELCARINQLVGQRTKKYQELLKIFQEALPSISNIQEVQKIRWNFSLIIQMMPSEIKQHTRIKDALTYLNKEINTAGHARIMDSLKAIQSELEQSYDPHQLDKLKEWVDLIEKEFPENLPPELTQNIQRCREIYFNKISIAGFA